MLGRRQLTQLTQLTCESGLGLCAVGVCARRSPLWRILAIDCRREGGEFFSLHVAARVQLSCALGKCNCAQALAQRLDTLKQGKSEAEACDAAALHWECCHAPIKPAVFKQMYPTVSLALEFAREFDCIQQISKLLGHSPTRGVCRVLSSDSRMELLLQARLATTSAEAAALDRQLAKLGERTASTSASVGDLPTFGDLSIDEETWGRRTVPYSHSILGDVWKSCTWTPEKQRFNRRSPS